MKLFYLNILIQLFSFCCYIESVKFTQEKCYVKEENKDFLRVTFECGKFRDTTALNYTIELVQDIPKDTAYKIQTFLWSNEKKDYVKDSFELHRKYCEFIQFEKFFYPDFVKYGTFPAKCPLKSNKMELYNYVIPEKNLPILPGMKVKAVITCLANKTVLYKAVWHLRATA